ncbi:MAG: GAF domain-containing protein, partial [Candidatus Zixiibacteriota bacterium]
PLIHKEIEGGKYVEENLLKAMGIRSRLILPLSRYGALTLGSLKTAHYQHKDAKWMNLIESVLTNTLIDLEMRDMIRKKDNLLMKLKEISDETLVEKENEKILSNIASNITKQLPTSFCRISLLEKDKNNLNTLALEKIRDQGIKLKEENTHSLSLLPWHRMVLETGKTMLVNQEDPESLMPDEECEEIMSKDLRSGILVPIIKDQNPVGVLSVGEMRSWNRRPFRQEEVAFVKSLANQIPSLLERDFKTSTGDSNIESEQGERLTQLGFEINSSLSTILGSVELIKSKKKNLDEETSKYLDIIEKGGQRIQKSFKGYSKPQQSEVSKVKKNLENQKVTA